MIKRFGLGIMMSSLIMTTLFLGSCGIKTNVEENKSFNSDLEKYELSNYRDDFDNLRTKTKLNSIDDIIIGFSLDTLKEPIWKISRDEFVNKATELGASVRVEQANGDDSVQLTQIDKLIAEGVNVLVISPHNGEVCAEAVEKAHNAGIKVLSYDRLIRNSDVDLYVSIDNYKVGMIQAQEMLRNVPSGNIAYVGGSELDNNAVLFRQGTMDILNLHKDSINIIMDKYSPEWNAEEAYNNVMELLEQTTDIQGIICANDSIAAGAIAALNKYGLSGKIPVTGLDAELSACQRIVEGTQLMTVYKPTKIIASTAATLAMKLAKGEKAAAYSSVNNGKIDVPTYSIEPVCITKENMMDTVIKDKFHEFDDVYKNISENERPKK